MIILLTVLHVIATIMLIVVILLQTGKAGGVGGIFGGGGSEQLFSTPSGTAFIRQVTIALAVVFFCTSLSLTFMSYKTSLRSVTDKALSIPAPTQQAPAQPPSPAE